VTKRVQEPGYAEGSKSLSEVSERWLTVDVRHLRFRRLRVRERRFRWRLRAREDALEERKTPQDPSRPKTLKSKATQGHKGRKEAIPFLGMEWTNSKAQENHASGFQGWSNLSLNPYKLAHSS
jgi:hypothetical protein